MTGVAGLFIYTCGKNCWHLTINDRKTHNGQ